MQTAENRTRYLGSFAVAPLAGAWIEIRWTRNQRQTLRVAPLAGAWIEIDRRSCHRSRPFVAPLAGAWIEIDPDVIAPGEKGSLPSRERGLKSTQVLLHILIQRSLPSRERGLKYCL